VGGDGTLNHLLNAVSGHRAIQIGVVPLGTANDLSGAHQSSGKQQGCLDLICVNGRRFVTVGGLGLPADVALQVNQLRGAPAQRSLRRVLGRWIYPAAAAWQILRRGKPLQMRLTYQCPTQGEKRFEGCVALMLVCNLGSLGGTLHASLESSPDDGVFELVLVPEQGRRQLLCTLLSMIRGNINSSPVLRLRATQANIEVTEPRWFFGDGELFTRDTHFELRLAPEKQEFLFLAPV
jgi:diacylglycerol kinase (ATP)